MECPPAAVLLRLNLKAMRILFVLFLIIALKNNANNSTPDPVIAWDIVIHEIMADPDPAAGNISYPEYIELYNKKNIAVGLKNWKLCIGTTCKTLPEIFIPADSFLVLTSTASVSLFPSGVNAWGISSFPAISNSGQTIQLLNESGTIISVVSYTEDWYNDEIKKRGGYSLEQIDAHNPCGEGENWGSSTNITGGTPGNKNSISKSNPDQKPPEVTGVSVINPYQIEVFFSEPMDSVTLADTAFYTISRMNSPLKCYPVKPFYKSVVLSLPDTLKQSIMYNLYVGEQIKDCKGNLLKTDNTIRFAIPVPAQKSDLIINEVLFDPKENGAEFIEIYNASPHTIDLKSVFLGHYDSISNKAYDIEKITGTSCLFFPEDYLVLSENVKLVKKQYTIKNEKAFLNVPDLPSLNNNEGSICLSTASEVIDGFAYHKDQHFALLKDTKGVSLERVNFSRATNEATNWHSAASSVGYATPGYKNSQSNDFFTDDEFKLYPEVFSPDQDGFNDQVTIYYTMNEPSWSATILIYDSSGRLIRTLVNNDLIGTKGAYSWDGTNDNRERERAGIYIVYMRVFNLSGIIKQYKKVCVLSEKN